MDKALQEFATAEPAARQLAALQELAQLKALSHAAKTQPFADGVRRLGTALEREDPVQRLHALAGLGRIWFSVKHLRPGIEKLVGSTAVLEPAPLQRLPDADERAYAAHASSLVTAAWVPRFAAAGAVAEESGEEARKACISAVLAATNDLTGTLTLFRERLGALAFNTERPSDSMARRIRRILSALHGQILGHRGLVAEDAGAALGLLLYESFRRLGPPPTQAVRRELVAAVSKIVHDIISVRFAQATQPATYDGLDVLSRWFQPYEWEELVTRMPEAQAIADDLLEAITLLTKAGITDLRMKAALAVATGSDRSAADRLRALAESVPGLSADIRDWLSGTDAIQVFDVLEESGARRLDQIIASVLVRHRAMEQLKAESGASGSRATVRTLVDAVFEIARARSLELAYTPGDLLEYSALDHELVGGARLGVRRVKILEPQVRARQSNGTFRVVRKALVEPAAE